MNSTSGASSWTPFTPSYPVHVYHPDTRAPLDFPLQVLTERIERALQVEVKLGWVPTLLALADGLFMQQEPICVGVSRVATLASLDPGSTVEQVPDVMEELLEHRICEQRTVEELYHLGRLDELSHPRVWELNGWWNKLYGVIATRSELDDEEDLDLWDEGPIGLKVGRISLPLGVSPERDEIRKLLENKLLSQYEPLYRLRLSWHK